MKVNWWNVAGYMIFLWYAGPIALDALRLAFWDRLEMRVVERVDTCKVRDGSEWAEIAEGCNAAHRMAFDEIGRVSRSAVLTVEWTARDGTPMREDYTTRQIDGALESAGPGTVLPMLVNPEGKRPPADPAPLRRLLVLFCGVAMLLWCVSPFFRETAFGNADPEDDDETVLYFRQLLLKLVTVALLVGAHEGMVEREFDALQTGKTTLAATVLSSDGHCAPNGQGEHVCRPDRGEENRTLLAYDHPRAGRVVRLASDHLFPGGMPVPGDTVILHTDPDTGTSISTPASVAAVDLNRQRPWAYGLAALFLALFVWLSLIDWRLIRRPDALYP